MNFSLLDKKKSDKTVKAELLQLKHTQFICRITVAKTHLFARELLLIKKLEMEKTKQTFIMSVLKVEY